MFGRKAKPKKSKKQPETPREWARHFLREWVQPFAIVLAIFLPFRSAIADWNDVPTGSMKPTIVEGDRIFVNKLAYGLRVPFTNIWVARWDTPSRGEIVVCKSPVDGKRLVKRLVAVPGDTIELRNATLFINGQPATYGPLDQDTIDQIQPDTMRRRFRSETVDGVTHAIMQTPTSVRADRTMPPFTLGRGEYFAMGDNRDLSLDSRSFGPIMLNEIVGRSGRVVLSLDHDNYYLPRLGRFFRKLP